MTSTHAILSTLLMLGAPTPWPRLEPDAQSLEARLPPPATFTRRDAPATSFATWARALPVLAGTPKVLLFDGRKKSNQAAQAAVLDIDVGATDLQQCADAVIRLHAEHLWSSDAGASACFRATDGTPLPWARFRSGERAALTGKRLVWSLRERPDDSYVSFRRFLDLVFTYAGTRSLERDLVRVASPARVEPGDVFVEGGSPGHAVVVLDVAENDAHERVFLLAQSYMPAQQIHVLRNPNGDSAWYPARVSGPLRTPEWTFAYEQLRRFSGPGCAERRPN